MGSKETKDIVSLEHDNENKKRNPIQVAKDVVVKAADRNGDGRIGRDDFGLGKEQLLAKREKAKDAAASAGNMVKKTGSRVEIAIEEKKTAWTVKALRPVFPQDIRSNISVVISEEASHPTVIPELIRIVERDKERHNQEVCEGSIGYLTTAKDIDILNVYKDCAAEIGIYFSPVITTTFYYMDPFKKDYYVSLDDYFSYVKKEQVSELERVAMNLGAKKVKITYKEQKKSEVKQDVRIGIKLPRSGGGSGTHEQSKNELSTIEIAADVTLEGHNEPKVPELIYFKNDSDIENLIKMQTGREGRQLKSKTYVFQCSKFSGMTEKTAAKIDSALRQLKCSGSASLTGRAHQESRTYLEYFIEF